MIKCLDGDVVYKMGEIRMLSLNVHETTKKKVGNGSLEFKEICSRVISLRVISIKIIVEEQQLTQAGVGKGKKGSHLKNEKGQHRSQ